MAGRAANNPDDPYAPPSYPVHPNLLGTQGAAYAAIGVLDSIPYDFASG